MIEQMRFILSIFAEPMLSSCLPSSKRFAIFSSPSCVLFISLQLLMGCTYAGKPNLTAREKETARVQLSRWSNGREVSYLVPHRTKLHGRYYASRGLTK